MFPQAVQRRSGRLVTALRKHYQPALQRDAELGELLDTVEEIYCGVRRGGGMDGMLGSLMHMLGGGGSSGAPMVEG